MSTIRSFSYDDDKTGGELFVDLNRTDLSDGSTIWDVVLSINPVSISRCTLAVVCSSEGHANKLFEALKSADFDVNV